MSLLYFGLKISFARWETTFWLIITFLTWYWIVYDCLIGFIMRLRNFKSQINYSTRAFNVFVVLNRAPHKQKPEIDRFYSRCSLLDQCYSSGIATHINLVYPKIVWWAVPVCSTKERVSSGANTGLLQQELQIARSLFREVYFLLVI